MRRIAMVGALVAATGMPAITHADFRDMEVSVGASPAIMNYRSQEPEGDTARETMTYPLTLTTTTEINRISRLYGDIRKVDVSFPAPQGGGIGATVEGYQLTAAYQRLFRWSRHIQPWFGIGVVASQTDVTSRYRTDSDGFLDQRLDDRTNNGMSAVVTGSLEWDLTRNWVVTTHARYEQPISDGLRGYGASAGVRYQF